MTSVMSARSPLSISKCRESVWPEAAERKVAFVRTARRKEAKGLEFREGPGKKEALGRKL